MIIGLTGGIGSGKSTVAQFFRDLKVTVIDADHITRQLVAPDQPAFKKILHHFGPSILQKEGTLNRALLRDRLFESLEDRKWLEALLHPLVKAEISTLSFHTPKGHYTVVEIPLLFEAECQDLVDRILVVDCFPAKQIERVMQRDGATQLGVEAIMATQTTRENRLTAAHDVIENEGSREALKAKVLAIHHYYNELAK